MRRRGNTLGKRISRKVSERVHGWDDGNSEKFSDPPTPRSRLSTRRSRREE